MVYVQGTIGQEITELMDNSNLAFDNKDFRLSILLLEQAWVKLTEPKINYDESFLIVWGILDICILINDIIKANQWVDKIFIADPERGDTGERDLWAGKVAFESGEFNKAEDYLKNAYRKSRGRCFGETDDKYLKFLINISEKK